MKTHEDLQKGLARKQAILKKKVKKLPETHKHFGTVVRALLSNGQQQKALRRNGQ